MIKVERHRLFKKFFKNLTLKQQLLFSQRMSLFLQNPAHPLLRVHSLKGDLENMYAFSLSGDLRVIFAWPEKDLIILHKVGTHNQVY